MTDVMMYDIQDDMEKPVTQEYLDMLVAAGEYGGLHRWIIKRLDAVPIKGEKINWVKERDRLREIRDFIQDNFL